ncbi:hypothetical protein BDQ17DRAFT_1412115, partial [Cyathus striatus]
MASSVLVVFKGLDKANYPRLFFLCKCCPNHLTHEAEKRFGEISDGQMKTITDIGEHHILGTRVGASLPTYHNGWNGRRTHKNGEVLTKCRFSLCPLIVHSSRNRSMLQLPPELWLQVTNHVPDKELYKLYCINNTFFQAALDRAYREVRLIDRCPSAFIHKLACLEHPLAGPRVKALCICPSAIAGALIATQDGLEGFVGVIKSIPASWFATSVSNPEDIFTRQMLSTLSKLTS